MIGSFITRALVMVFGYAFPAYECYKAVEKNRPEIEQLRFWCQYWILVAVLSVCERIADAFISWVPMYSEAKLAFVIYLWYPKTKGTTYVYDSFFRPYVAKHETEIDRNLLELRTRAGDIAVLYWQKAASYGQTRIFEILQYVAAQSTPSPRPAQQQPAVRVRQPASSNSQPAAATEPQAENPSSPTSSSSSQHQKEVAEKLGSSQVPKAPYTVAGLSSQKSNPIPAEDEPMQIEAAPPSSSSANENENPPLEDTIMEESIRVTRAWKTWGSNRIFQEEKWHIHYVISNISWFRTDLFQPLRRTILMIPADIGSGGVIRDSVGNWLAGFYAYDGTEIMGFRQGLQSWVLGLRNIICEYDNLPLVNPIYW
ncbi:HVA22-like protein i isoform D [Glycine soja]|uniref:HVA22-like protein n=2 Tax=Glycine subgen. Soja TaxID=1462606 RepID=A0A445K3Q3_GLYSO|nr:HVA22-like protein i isoform C [Glycine soja]RZC05436.1 HVA22-like protein i isoform D [Glycine soja]